MAVITKDYITYTDLGERDRLAFALFIAAVIHAVLLFMVVFDVDTQQAIKQTLNVTLATHRSEVAPEKADFAAQTNQQGSGSLDEKRELSTPVTSEFQDTVVREVNLKEQTSPKQVKPTENNRVRTESQSRFKTWKVIKDQESEENLKMAEEVSILQRSLEIASLEAQQRLQKQIYAKRPKKRAISSASTKEARDAAYLHQFRSRIEYVGNKHYPDHLKVFGSVMLQVDIKQDGSVIQVKVKKSSGNTQLDSEAIKIVHKSAPFQPFPDEIKLDTDILQIIRTWVFEPGKYLSSY